MYARPRQAVYEAMTAAKACRAASGICSSTPRDLSWRSRSYPRALRVQKRSDDQDPAGTDQASDAMHVEFPGAQVVGGRVSAVGCDDDIVGAKSPLQGRGISQVRQPKPANARPRQCFASSHSRVGNLGPLAGQCMAYEGMPVVTFWIGRDPVLDLLEIRGKEVAEVDSTGLGRKWENVMEALGPPALSASRRVVHPASWARRSVMSVETSCLRTLPEFSVSRSAVTCRGCFCLSKYYRLRPSSRWAEPPKATSVLSRVAWASACSSVDG